MDREESLGLYIHIPYCKSKCGYCDFTSYVDKWHTLPDYLNALRKEAQWYYGNKVDTVYIGGGTPSCLRDGDIQRLLHDLRTILYIDDQAEISIEANPNSLSRKKAAEFWNAGINRLSIGLQTVQPDLLKSIGRTHVYSDLLEALFSAKEVGFSNINVDLMYALPGEKVEQAIESAEKVSRLPITHISAYALRLERGTPLYGAPQPDEEQDRAMFYGMKCLFEREGFERYEISNFAKKGYVCQHNLKYWRSQQYIGLGVAAHSCYRGYRYGNTASITGYIKKINSGESAVVQKEPEEKSWEKLMLKTRLCEGISVKELPHNDKMRSFLELLKKNKLAIYKNDTLILTDKGMDIHNTIVLKLLECI